MIATKLSLTLIKGRFGRLPCHRGCLKGLGLRKVNQTVVVFKNPQNMGMIEKVSYMLRVEEL